MAKQVWIDKLGGQHDSEAQALKAEASEDERAVVEGKLQLLVADQRNHTSFDLEKCESWGPGFLEPVVKYFNRVFAEAEERAAKYGSVHSDR